MNWTGGRLQHCRHAERTRLTAEQRAYFSRAEKRLLLRLTQTPDAASQTRARRSDQHPAGDSQHVSPVGNGCAKDFQCRTHRRAQGHLGRGRRATNSRTAYCCCCHALPGGWAGLRRGLDSHLSTTPPGHVEALRIWLLGKNNWLN